MPAELLPFPGNQRSYFRNLKNRVHAYKPEDDPDCILLRTYIRDSGVNIGNAAAAMDITSNDITALINDAKPLSRSQAHALHLFILADLAMKHLMAS